MSASNAVPGRTLRCTLEPMAFPATRMRRLRRTAVLRDLVRETRLDPGDFVLPLFVEAGLGGRPPIEAMPGVDPPSISQGVGGGGGGPGPPPPPPVPLC